MGQHNLYGFAGVAVAYIDYIALLELGEL